MTTQEKNRAIELLKEAVASATEYTTTEDNLDCYMEFPKENDFVPTIAWDNEANNYEYMGEHQGRSLDVDNDGMYNIYDMSKCYGYYDVEDMLSDIYDNVTVESCFYCNSYGNTERNRMVWGEYALSEIGEQLSEGELFDLLLKGTEDELTDIANDADCTLGRFDATCDTIEYYVYLGGVVVIFSEMKAVFEYLNDKLTRSM